MPQAPIVFPSSSADKYAWLKPEDRPSAPPAPEPRATAPTHPAPSGDFASTAQTAHASANPIYGFDRLNLGK